MNTTSNAINSSGKPSNSHLLSAVLWLFGDCRYGEDMLDREPSNLPGEICRVVSGIHVQLLYRWFIEQPVEFLCQPVGFAYFFGAYVDHGRQTCPAGLPCEIHVDEVPLFFWMSLGLDINRFCLQHEEPCSNQILSLPISAVLIKSSFGENSYLSISGFGAHVNIE